MVLTPAASPVNGAPGAVIIYALLAVLLWPSDRHAATAPFTAARAVGVQPARLAWLVLWASLAYFALLPGNRTSAGAERHDRAAWPAGSPGWLAALDNHAASLLAHQGLAASIVLAIALLVVAVGVYLPVPAARATVLLAIVLAALFWVFGEAFGTILTGGGTDPNSGPAADPAGPGLLAAEPGGRHPAAAAQCPPRPGDRRGRSDGMMTPSWILDIFAAVMLLIAGDQRRPAGDRPPVARGAVMDADIDGCAPADGHRHGGHAGGQPDHAAQRRLGRRSSP